MGHIVMVGGGIVGTCAAMMLARDGHEVTVLERDPAPPPAPDSAWDTWERRGVNQFRLLHYLLPPFLRIVDTELPGLSDAFRAAGALDLNPVDAIPAEFTGGPQEGDERFAVITARRPVAEAVVASFATGVSGLTIRRGVAVAGVASEIDTATGLLHVTGVRTADGEEIAADLVVDAAGRRSPMAEMLRTAGSPGPHEMVEDSGFVYYGRHFRSADGSIPPAFGGLLEAYGSISILTLPADNGTWGVGIIASSADPAMRAARDLDCWERIIRAHPLVAHWIDAESLSDGVEVMANIADRKRTYVIDGEPVATGVLPLADAWACTNPSLGRGISIGAMHAVALRDLLHDESFDDPRGLALAWHATTEATVQPFVESTLHFDRHRLAEIDAAIAGHPYEPNDPVWTLASALDSAKLADPEALRAFMDLASVNKHGNDVFAAPGLVEKVLALANPAPPLGPDRAQLLELIGA